MNIQNIESMVAQFAKECKCSKTKANSFAQAILAIQKPAGRPTSDESLRIRQALKDMQEDLIKAGVFTVKEVAAKINADQANTNNALRFLSEKEGRFKVVGKKAKLAGQRGRCEVEWACS